MLQHTVGNRAASRLIARLQRGSPSGPLLQRDELAPMTFYGFAPGYQSKAGKPFPSADAAAIVALEEIQDVSLNDNLEYAGRIYRRSDGSFSFSPPARGENASSDPSMSPVPASVTVVGTYHSHAGGFNPTDELYSPDDKLKAEMATKVSYLLTPRGNIFKYTPGSLLPVDQQQPDGLGIVTDLTPQV
jgi:hypothetical protein